MNIKIVLRVLGFLLLFLGAAMLFVLPFSFYYNSGDHISIIISALICFGFGILSFISTEKRQDIHSKDGFAIVTFGWLIMSIFSTLPYMLSGAIPNFTDAIFESISGFTTTGATILTDIESLPEGILLWRSLTHWIGGMGIIVLTIAILPFLGVGGMQMFKAESPGPMSDKLAPSITQTAKLLWGVYVLFTFTEAVLLYFGGMNVYESLNHAFSTMATGGFSTKNASIAHYDNPFIHYVIIVFMFLAGANFSMHYRVLTGNIRSLLKSAEFRFYISVLFISSIIIFTDVYQLYENALEPAIRDTIFQVLAINTTTGFVTADYEQWSTTSQILLFTLMFCGGMAGSTAGGIKAVRVLLLLKYGYSQFVRVLHPKAIVPVRLGDNKIDDKTMQDILGYFVLFVFIAAISTLVMTTFGLNLETAISLVAATINNIGPGLDLIGPTDNYAFLPEPAKWISSFLMLIGRLELLTVIILLSPSYWRK